jgi:branched-chain amino acid transport system permease protein
MLSVHFMLQRTKLGKAMRAMADNKDLAQVTGIPTERVIRATWAIGGGLAGVSGFLIVLEKGTLSFNLDLHEISLSVAAIVLMLSVHFMLQRTKLGKAMRAMADNKDLAQVTGIPTERVIRATWAIGGGLAGVSGFLIVLEKGTLSFNLGWLLLLLIFAGVILGGIGSVYGAIGGGLIIGVVSRLSLVWIPSDFARAAAFLIMILVLLYRPEGLFGGVKTA